MNPNDNNKNTMETVNKDEFPKNLPEIYEKFQNFLKNNEGIENLWKKVEKNENNTKEQLFKAENAIITTVDDLMATLNDYQSSSNYKKPDEKEIKKQKSEYGAMIDLIYNGHQKEGENFKKKFPNWVFDLRRIISSSNHFKRISNFDTYSNTIDKVARPRHSFIDISTQDLDIKFANRQGKTGKFMKSLKKFGKFFTGKASKTGVEKKVQAFFKRVNAPWRMWWEVVCEKDQKLSREKAKDQLKNALNKGSKPELMSFFNQPDTTTASLNLNIDKSQGVFLGDSNNAQRDKMLSIFCNLDKKLGNKAREDVFGLGSVKEKSFIQKVKGLFKGSKKPAEQKNTNAIEMQNLNQQQQNQPANGGVNVQQPAQQPNQQPKEGGNKKPQIDLSGVNDKRVNEINGLLNSKNIPENDKVKDFNNDGVIIEVLSLIAEKEGIVYGKGREEFLVSLTKYFGLKGFDKNNIDLICEKYIKDLPKEWQDSLAVKTVQRVRNLIRYGYYGKITGKNNKLPEIKKK